MTTTNHQTLPLREAAERLRVSYQTAFRWVNSGTLPARKVGQRWRIPAAEVERLLEPLPFSVPPCEESRG